ncbi:diacylglycerol/lipid kinase family protein [Dermabacteraceae bacterium CCM 9519]
MTRLRVGLLVNPSAAGGGAMRLSGHVANLLRLAGLSVVDVTGPNAKTARARALSVLPDLSALIVVGGDGTVSLGAAIVAGTDVRLGIIPAGTGNDQARSLRLPLASPDEAIRVMLESLSLPPLAIDAMEISSDGANPYRALALGSVSLGFDALVTARANSGRKRRGSRYAVAAAQEIRRFRDLPYLVSFDGGEPEEVDASLLSVVNAPFLGGGMNLVPQANMRDGVIEVATVSGVGRLRLLSLLPQVYRGSHVSHPAFKVRRVKSVSVALRDNTLLRAHGDGEPHCLLPLTVKIVPQAVNVLAPHTADCLEKQ